MRSLKERHLWLVFLWLNNSRHQPQLLSDPCSVEQLPDLAAKRRLPPIATVYELMYA